MIDLSVNAQVEAVNAAALPTVLDLFLQERDRRALDPRTVANYGHQLQPFADWWRDRDDPVLSEAALADFWQWLSRDWVTATGNPPAPSTVHTVARRVRQFLRWLHRTGRLPVDVSDWMPLPPSPDPAQRFLDRGQLQAVLDAIPPGSLRFRDRATFALLGETGARRFEVAELLEEDVHVDPDLSGGWARLRRVKGDAQGRGQGRVVAFGPVTAQAVHQWRLHQALMGLDWADDPRLLQMTNTAIRLRVAKWAAGAGFALGAHDFRRTFSDHWLEHCPDRARAMLLLKLQLGHTIRDDVTLAHYINTKNPGRVVDQLRAVYVSPLAGLDWSVGN
jgi:integrase